MGKASAAGPARPLRRLRRRRLPRQGPPRRSDVGGHRRACRISSIAPAARAATRPRPWRQERPLPRSPLPSTKPKTAAVRARCGRRAPPWLAALHRINRSATADLNLSDRLATAVRVLADTTSADACGIMLYDETTDTLALRAAVGLNPVAVGALTLHPGTGITGAAAAERRVHRRAGRPRALRPTSPSPRPARTSMPRRFPCPWCSAVAASRKSLVGVINLFTLAAPGVFRGRDRVSATGRRRTGHRHRERPTLQPHRRPAATQDHRARHHAAGLSHHRLDPRSGRCPAPDRRAGRRPLQRRGRRHLPLPGPRRRCRRAADHRLQHRPRQRRR